MVERDISRLDVFRCIEEGEIIEDYPNAFPYPCSLVFGYAFEVVGIISKVFGKHSTFLISHIILIQLNYRFMGTTLAEKTSAFIIVCFFKIRQ